jgi:hypothetical protein
MRALRRTDWLHDMLRHGRRLRLMGAPPRSRLDSFTLSPLYTYRGC